MSFFKNMQLSQRLVLAMAIPFVGLLLLGALAVFERYSTLKSMDNVQELANLGPEISNLVHELQKERGKSAGFIASGGVNFADTIEDQRKATDVKQAAMLKAFEKTHFNYFSSDLETAAQDALKALKGLEASRDNVRNLKISVPEMAKYYTPTIRKLLKIVEVTVVLTTDPVIVRETQAYVDLLQGKERAGVERAMGAVGFGKGVFPPKIYNKFVSLGAEQAVFFRGYMKLASPEEQKYFKKSVSGKDVEEVIRMRNIALKGGLSGQTENITAKYWFKESTVRINLLKKVEDHIAADIVQIATAKGSAAKNQLIAILAVLLVMIIIASYTMRATIKKISTPLKNMTTSMGELAEGNLDIEIRGTESKDELGAMARAMNVFLGNAQERKTLREKELERANKKVETQKELQKAIANFKGEIQSVVSAIEATTNNVSSTATELSDMSQTSLERTDAVSNASTEASSNVQCVASASEQLSASISEISQQLDLASQIVGQAVNNTHEANSEVTQLASAADKIGEVVSLIKDIAEQTNLLALNATIESARAGEMGKGFAVVASEVKALAAQTSKATEEISTQIEGIQSSTSGTVDALGTMISTMDKVEEITRAISTAVNEQSEATREISSNIQRASDGTQTVTQAVSHIADAANNSSIVVNDMQESSRELKEKAGTLDHSVTRFLEKVS